jgi:hypothetical protein
MDVGPLDGSYVGSLYGSYICLSLDGSFICLSLDGSYACLLYGSYVYPCMVPTLVFFLVFVLVPGMVPGSLYCLNVGPCMFFIVLMLCFLFLKWTFVGLFDF